MDQRRRGSPRALMLTVCEGSIECPRRRLAPHGRTTGFLGSKRQRAIGSRIQIADIARHLEEAALRGKHENLFVETNIIVGLRGVGQFRAMALSL